MPNHVENHIEFNGDRQQIDAMLNKIKGIYPFSPKSSGISVITLPP